MEILGNLTTKEMNELRNLHAKVEKLEMPKAPPSAKDLFKAELTKKMACAKKKGN